MARIARIVLPRKAHLVCQGGDRPLFNSAKRRTAFTRILTSCADTYRVKVVAWALLSKKAYLVVVPPSAEALSSFMRVAQTRFARYLHANGYKGEVTPRRFASCPLDNNAAREAIRYVESRPVAEGLVRVPADYAFSSAAVRNKNASSGDGLLSVVPAITDSIRGRHTAPLPNRRAEYLAMRMRTGKPAGAPAFVRRVEQQVGMNLSRGRGRPRGT